MIDVYGITAQYKGLSNRLVTKAKILNSELCCEEDAQWDTGASISCVSEEVAKKLDLTNIAYKNIATPSSSDTVRSFVVDVALTDDLIIRNVQVCESKIGMQKIGLLIGMNILSKGDFAVSNFNGRTTFTFRSPSIEEIDFATMSPSREAAATEDTE